MIELDNILEQCPHSNAEQEKFLWDRYGNLRLKDLQGAIVFGAAKLGAQVGHELKNNGIGIQGFSDNDPSRWNGMHMNLPIFAPQHLDRHRPVIIASKYVKEIYGALREQGTKQLIPYYILPILFPGKFTGNFHCLSAAVINAGKKDIKEVYSFLHDQHSKELFVSLLKFRISLDPLELPDPTGGQYFPGDFWQLSSREVFVDVGACTGDTLADFLHYTAGEFSRYIGFEPDPHNFDELRKAIPAALAERIWVFSSGVGAKRQFVSFLSNQGGESRVDSGGALTVELAPLDEVLSQEAVSTIKIDVEGFEREVLNGARSIISERAPKLAVSVYHRPQDLWELPVWIKTCNGGYTFYLRHHTQEIYDTVLYCVSDGKSKTQNGFQKVNVLESCEGGTKSGQVFNSKASRS